MDLIGGVLDVLPLRRVRGLDGASTADVTAVASVIEPDVNQLIGALVLRRSLERSPAPTTYRFCVVDRGPHVSDVLDTCAMLGVEAAASPARHGNPFLNKWLVLDAFPDLRHEPHVALLDWDTLLCAAKPLPGPFRSGIGGRRNRSSMYRDLIDAVAEPLPSTPAVLWGRVRSSINGGVLVGSGASLHSCAEKTVAWVADVGGRAPEAPPWKVEQLSLSIAVGELGLISLGTRWNATPQERLRVADGDVCVWHYNDGVESSRLLKQCLNEPARARGHLDQLAERWPRTVALFSELYAEVLGLDPVARLLSRPP